jgi:transcriptional regulator with XRE-family HTH domain
MAVYCSIMATERIQRDPTSERVARNLAELRDARGLSLRDLHVRLRDVGRPILPSGLHKIESGDRRVDVDDLVALAVALDVSPSRLLMPAGASGRRVQLTPKVKGSERTLWAWAAGDEALPERGQPFDLDRAGRFRVENRPHDPPSDMTLDDIEEHRDVLAPLTDAVRKARDSGLSFGSVAEYVRLTETTRMVARIVEQAQAKEHS